MKILTVLLFPALMFSAEKVTILRDEFGVPNIFASTPAGAMYGSGYAQAEDRLEELLKNYRKAEGTMAEVFGPSWYQSDYRQRLWRHREVAEKHYGELPANVRALAEAYQAGVKRFMSEHPEQVPKWAPQLAPWQIIALGRFIIWGWPEGDAGRDLRKDGIQPDPIGYHGSNEMLVAPSRSSLKVPLAVIDPHVPWYDEFRWYEERLYAPGMAIAGGAILGLPFPSLGHSQWASVAMTTGGPDTGDAYIEEVKDGKYLFRGEWRPLRIRVEKIGVNDGGTVKWREATIEETHHGPIVAHKNGKAYSLALSYSDEFRLFEQSWRMWNAHNLAQMKDALSMLELMGQNVMVATVEGDVYYVRNGRTPVRPAGCDTLRPMPGTDGTCEWNGIHAFGDLLQITNPPQGYMQNCNTSPALMMKDSPYLPSAWKGPFYLYNEGTTEHQREAMVRELLDGATSVTPERMMGIALSPRVYKAETWQARVKKAAPDHELTPIITGWNRRNDADSRAAVVYGIFKTSLPGNIARMDTPPDSLTDSTVRKALDDAARRLKTEVPPGAVWGTLFRVGREGSQKTWPMEGGSFPEAAMVVPRNISFKRKGDVFFGVNGQSVTQVVVLTKPPQSWSVVPFGESDHPESGHFEDQAEKLYSRAKLKPTYFLDRKELEKHVTARRELIWQ